MSRRLSTRPLTALAAAALLLTACSADTGGEATSTASESAGQGADGGDGGATDSGAKAAQDLQAAAGEDAEPQPIAEELPVLATREASDGSTPLEIDLNSVSASGEVMTVVFTARNLAEDGSWQISEFFDDGYGTAPMDPEGTRGEDHETLRAWATDGVTVIDTANGMLHRAAYDTAGNCACNVDLGSTHVGAGESIVLTTAFAAPPEEVQTVSVQIPGAGSFDDVPLTR